MFDVDDDDDDDDEDDYDDDDDYHNDRDEEDGEENQPRLMVTIKMMTRLYCRRCCCCLSVRVGGNFKKILDIGLRAKQLQNKSIKSNLTRFTVVMLTKKKVFIVRT